MIVKTGIVLIGTGVMSVGFTAITHPHLFGINYIPKFHALSKDEDFSSAKYSSGQIGNKFKNYLVGVTVTKENKRWGNKAWWRWAYRKLQKDEVSSGKFQVTGKDKKVDEPYGVTLDKALNKVCEQAYKTDYSTGFKDNDKDKFSKSDVWKYCSPLGKEPSKIETDKYKGKIGESIQSEAISVEDKENDIFWSIRDKEVRGKNSNLFTQVPSGGITSGHFSNKSLTMKELCRQAYEMQKGSSESATDSIEADAKKYCKFEISES